MSVAEQYVILKSKNTSFYTVYRISHCAATLASDSVHSILQQLVDPLHLVNTRLNGSITKDPPRIRYPFTLPLSPTIPITPSGLSDYG